MIAYQTTRKWARNTHILVALYQFMYIYGPLHHTRYGFHIVQWIAFPLLFLTAIWLSKGKKLWKWMQKRRNVLL